MELRVIQESLIQSSEVLPVYELTFQIDSCQLKMPALIFDHLKFSLFLVFSFLQLSFWRQNESCFLHFFLFLYFFFASDTFTGDKQVLNKLSVLN